MTPTEEFEILGTPRYMLTARRVLARPTDEVPAPQVDEIVRRHESLGHRRVQHAALPEGFVIFACGDDSFVAISRAGVESGSESSESDALEWVVDHDRFERGLVPRYGELWADAEDASVILLILGTHQHRDGTFWAAYNDTGETVYPPAADLQIHPGRYDQPLDETARKCTTWAAAGNGDAAWWLGDYYEHGGATGEPSGRKALGYYVAAIRLLPRLSRNLIGRVVADCGHFFSLDNRPTKRQRREAEEAVALLLPELAGGPPVDWRTAIAIAEAGDAT